MPVFIVCQMQYRQYTHLLAVGINMATQTVLVDAVVSRTMCVILDYTLAYSDIRYQTSLIGFLYYLSYAWSVASEVSYTSAIDLIFSFLLIEMKDGVLLQTRTLCKQQASITFT